jgi:hypothetical protein
MTRFKQLAVPSIRSNEVLLDTENSCWKQQLTTHVRPLTQTQDKSPLKFLSLSFFCPYPICIINVEVCYGYLSIYTNKKELWTLKEKHFLRSMVQNIIKSSHYMEYVSWIRSSFYFWCHWLAQSWTNQWHKKRNGSSTY